MSAGEFNVWHTQETSNTACNISQWPTFIPFVSSSLKTCRGKREQTAEWPSVTKTLHTMPRNTLPEWDYHSLQHVRFALAA